MDPIEVPPPTRLSSFGLTGFGLCTLLLGLLLSGLVPVSPLLATAILFYGAVLQIVAGVRAWKKTDSFAATFFLPLGLFWLSLVALFLLPLTGWGEPPQPIPLGGYLALWGLFGIALLLQAGRRHRVLQLMFAALVLLLLLMAAAMIVAAPALRPFAGLAGIACGLIALYACLAEAMKKA